jgi:Tol biopolymer transport system component
MSLLRYATALIVATAAAVVVPGVAHATVPGANGRIAFSVCSGGSDEIFTMNPDGSDERQITNTTGDNFDPDWSPSGGRFVFTSTRDVTSTNIFTMNADGSNQVRLTGPGGANVEPSWSPDGSKIAYVAAVGTGRALMTMNADGSGKSQITGVVPFASAPAWSPNGTSIAFGMQSGTNLDVYRINPNGTGLTRLTTAAGNDDSPTWSPDGNKLAFTTVREGQSKIYAMNADGSAQTRLTNNSVPDFRPAWSPDGNKIAFHRAGGSVWDMYVMNADGSAQTKVSDTAGSGLAWQSIPKVSVTGVSAVEGTSATVTVQLARPLAEPLTVTIATSSGSATSGADYQATSVTRTFAPQSTTVTVPVSLLEDTIDEQNETVGISVSGALIAPASGSVTIVDNDPPPVVGVADNTASEVLSSASVILTLDRPSSRPVTVTATTGGGTATVGTDYQATQVSWTFPPLTTSAVVFVPLVNDSVAEPNETFGVTLSGPVNATIGDGSGTITITDDDTPSISAGNVTVTELSQGVFKTATVTVSLSHATNQPVTVDYATADDTATGGVDYVRSRGRLTIPAGQTSTSVALQVTSDGDAVTTERFFVNLSDAAGATLSGPQGRVTLVDCTTTCTA